MGRFIRGVVTGLILAAGVGIIWLRPHGESLTGPSAPPPRLESAPAAPCRLPPAEELANLEASGPVTPWTQARWCNRLERWLLEDGAAAFAYLRARQFQDLLHPSSARVFALVAPPVQLETALSETGDAFTTLNILWPNLTAEQRNRLRTMAATFPDGARRRELVAAMAGGEADENLDEALRFSATLTDPPTRDAAYAGILDRLRETGRVATAKELFALLEEKGGVADASRVALGTALLDEDADAAFAQFRMIQDTHARQVAWIAAARRLADLYPEKALVAVAQSDLSTEAKTRHARPIFARWLAQSPEMAARYLPQLTWLDAATRERWLTPADP